MLVSDVPMCTSLVTSSDASPILYTFGPNHVYENVRVFVRPTCLPREMRDRIEALRMDVLEVPGVPEHFVEVHYVGNHTFLLKDVTDVVEEQQRVETQRREAEKTKALLQLAGAAAHEMNQPLTIIMGYVGILIDQHAATMGPDVEKGLDAIKKSALRLAEIVRKISDIQSHKVKPYVGSTDILDLDASAEV